MGGSLFLFGRCLPNMCVCRSLPGASAACISFAYPLICPVLLSCCLSSSSVMVVVGTTLLRVPAHACLVPVCVVVTVCTRVCLRLFAGASLLC